MKQAYPVVMTQGKNHIIVFVPDFEINTQGKDYAEAMEMARDAIGIMGIDMEDDNEPLPSPTGLDAVRSGAAAGAVISLVDVDFGEYRRKNDLRAVKKNCTIPSWLNFEAEKAGINFSSLLQAAIKRELKIENK
jgi:predicted RNase H-like HicB family nuclease